MFKTIALIALVHASFIYTSSNTINNFVAHPDFHTRIHVTSTQPYGLPPSTIKSAYNLPSTGGTGKIAIIDAYTDPYIQSDLGVFDTQYRLASCTTQNGCLTIQKMANRISSDAGWALETSLDVEWAHAIAPSAKILLVEARSSGGNDLLSAIDYARRQPGVTAVSMSWGGSEFSSETNYDNYFTSLNGQKITFFASSGDNGTGVSWPAVSANVTGVGGTSLAFQNGLLSSETAWSGSGGGISSYVTEPTYQRTYNIQDNNLRAVPDVSFDADPNSGVSVYDSFTYDRQSGWWQVGGTSLGAPSWAAIKALGSGSNANYYSDSTIIPNSFRDITNGSNGTCGIICTASTGYDFVTGLGSPLKINY